MFGVTVFLLNFTLNACRWVMHLLLPASPPFPIILYLNFFIHLPAWLLETFGFDTSKISCGLPSFPCRASTLTPSLLSGMHLQSAIQTPCTLRHLLALLSLSVSTPGVSSFWLPQVLPCPHPNISFIVFLCVHLGERVSRKHLIESCGFHSMSRWGFTGFWRIDLYTVLHSTVLALYSVSKRKYVSNSKQLNSEWIWWPNPFITWELQRSKFWWVLWRGLWRHTVLN